MKKAKATTVKSKKGVVLGWDTSCADCGKAVRFTKGVRYWMGEAENKPDDHARCHGCFEAAKDRYHRQNRMR